MKCLYHPCILYHLLCLSMFIGSLYFVLCISCILLHSSHRIWCAPFRFEASNPIRSGARKFKSDNRHNRHNRHDMGTPPGSRNAWFGCVWCVSRRWAGVLRTQKQTTDLPFFLSICFCCWIHFDCFVLLLIKIFQVFLLKEISILDRFCWKHMATYSQMFKTWGSPWACPFLPWQCRTSGITRHQIYSSCEESNVKNWNVKTSKNWNVTTKQEQDFKGFFSEDYPWTSTKKGSCQLFEYISTLWSQQRCIGNRWK